MIYYVTALLLCFGFCSIQLNSAELGPGKTNTSQIRIVPVLPTPESDNVSTTITFPKAGQKTSQPVEVQVQLAGYPTGTMSEFRRKSEILNDPNGQSMRVIVDEYPYLSIYLSFIDTLDDNNIYYSQTLNKTVPYSLKNGVHVLRCFPVRSYGESLKGAKCFAACLFYTGQVSNSEAIDLSAPFLTYNMPQGDIPYKEGGPVLLDFYISNTRLSKDGYKVQVTIDGHIERSIYTWAPYYIYGLSKGKHTIRLELLDGQNEKVPGLLNDVQKEITLY